MNEYILKLGQNAKKASKELLTIDTRIKNRALREIAKALIERKEEIKLANQKDIENGKETGLSFALLDRLELNDNRIEGMAESLNVIAGFVDPIGEILNGWKHQNGLLIEKKRVPLGVIGIIISLFLLMYLATGPQFILSVVTAGT